MLPCSVSNTLISNLNLVEYNVANEPDALFQGCNAEVVDLPDHQSFKLPRTLYHLFFIHLSLLERHNLKETYDYLLIEQGILLSSPADFPLYRNFKSYTEMYMQTKKVFHRDISLYFKKSGIDPAQLKWREVVQLIEQMMAAFPDYYTYPKGRQIDFIYTFYRFMFRQDNRKQFEKVLLKCISLEWQKASHFQIFYRSAMLHKDNLTRDNGDSQSLSFGCSPLSGALFEGGFTGTCPMVYQLNHLGRDLYALILPPKKIERYFFNPPILSGLYALVAVGEFSHQRLRMFPSDLKEIAGVQSQIEEAKALVLFDLKKNPKIETSEAYHSKIRKMFSKHLQVIVLNQTKK